MYKKRSGFKTILTVFVTILLTTTVFYTATGATIPHTHRSIKLPHSVPTVLQAAKFIKHYNTTAMLHLTIGLVPRHLQDLKMLITEQDNPNSKLFHKYLTPREFDARFAPTTKEIKAIETYYASEGFKITNTWSDNLGFDLVGPVSIVERVFNIAINQYKYMGHVYYSNAQNPSIPSQFYGIISSISGLTNFSTYTPLLSYSLPNTTLYKVLSVTHHTPVRQISTFQGFTAYDPSDIRAAYNVNAMYAHGYTGKGVSIAIVGVGTPAISDVNGFAKMFLGKTHISFKVKNIDGISPYPDPYVESTLDIEWALAMAPNASITMVMGANPSDDVFNDMYAYVVNTLKPDIMSVSWGLDEYDSGAQVLAVDDYLFMQGAVEGISMFAASGDSGAYDQGFYGFFTNQYQPMVDFPASDPYITASGGTSLYVYMYHNITFAYKSEMTWGGGTPGLFNSFGSGGGYSMYFSEPSWQYYAQSHGVGQYNGMRGVPDISFNANPYTGDWIYYDGMLYGPIGGTSIAAPELAGVFALYDQMLAQTSNNTITQIGFVNPTIYNIAANASIYPLKPFHDIVKGYNGYYYATAGWDPTTGLGSPQVYGLGMDILLYFKLSKAFSTPQIFITTSMAQTLPYTNITFSATELGGVYSRLVYQWNFGDEHNSTGVVVEHAYTTPGFYTVVLTVKGYIDGAQTFILHTSKHVDILNAGTVHVSVIPHNVCIYMDGQYIGNTSSFTVTTTTGTHMIYAYNIYNTSQQFSKLIYVTNTHSTDVTITTLYSTPSYKPTFPNLQTYDSLENFTNSYYQWQFSPSYGNYAYSFNPYGGLYTYYYGANKAGATNLLDSDGNYIFGIDEVKELYSDGFIIQVANLSLPTGNINASDYMLNRIALFDPYTYSELALQQITINGMNYTELVYRYNLESIPVSKVLYYKPATTVSFTLYTDGMNNITLWAGLNMSGKVLFTTHRAGMNMVLANLVYRSLYKGNNAVFNSIKSVALYSVDTGIMGMIKPKNATITISSGAYVYRFNSQYYAPLQPGKYTLSITAPGYQSQTYHFTVAWDQMVVYNISLNHTGNFVSFTSPLNNTVLSGLVPINISVSVLNSSVYYKDYLYIYLDGHLLANLTPLLHYVLKNSKDYPNAVTTAFCWYWNSLNVTDGMHMLTLNAEIYTTTNQSVFAYAQINISTQNYAKPSVSIQAPLQNAVLHGMVNISFNYSSNVIKAILSIDNVNMDVTGFYNYTWNTFNVGDGSHNITLTVTSETYMSNSISVIVYTHNSPSATIIAPSANTTVSGTITFKFAYSSDVTKATLTIDNTSFVVTGETSFIFNTAILKNGKHTVLYTVTNAHGFYYSTKLTLRTHNVPIIAITNPPNNETVVGSLFVTFSVSSSYLKSVYLILDGVVHNVTGTNMFVINTLTLHDGIHYLTLVVTTAAGTFKIVRTFYTLNYKAPKVVLFSPSTGQNVSGNVSIVFEYSGNGIVSAILTINGTHYNVTGLNTFVLNTKTLANGNYTLTLTVTNKEGLTTNKTIIIHVLNPSAPTVDIYLVLSIIIALFAILAIVGTYIYTKKRYTRHKRIIELEPNEKQH